MVAAAMTQMAAATTQMAAAVTTQTAMAAATTQMAAATIRTATIAATIQMVVTTQMVMKVPVTTTMGPEAVMAVDLAKIANQVMAETASYPQTKQVQMVNRKYRSYSKMATKLTSFRTLMKKPSKLSPHSAQPNSSRPSLKRQMTFLPIRRLRRKKSLLGSNKRLSLCLTGFYF